MKIKPGQIWKDGNGDIIKIVNISKTNATSFPVDSYNMSLEHDGYSFTLEGTVWSNSSSACDLKKYLSKKEYPELYI